MRFRRAGKLNNDSSPTMHGFSRFMGFLENNIISFALGCHQSPFGFPFTGIYNHEMVFRIAHVNRPTTKLEKPSYCQKHRIGNKERTLSKLNGIQVMTTVIDLMGLSCRRKVLVDDQEKFRKSSSTVEAIPKGSGAFSLGGGLQVEVSFGNALEIFSCF